MCVWCGKHPCISAAKPKRNATAFALSTGSVLSPAGQSLQPAQPLVLEQPPSVYGDAAPLDYACLLSGRPISGHGRRQFCIDVPDAEGQKMVVNVLAPRTPVEAVQIGGTTYLRGDNSTAVAAHTGASTLAAVGAIIEVKPFQQACELRHVPASVRPPVRVQLQRVVPPATRAELRAHRRRAEPRPLVHWHRRTCQLRSPPP